MSATNDTPIDDSLAETVADLKARIEALEADRDRLEAENEQLRDRVDDLESQARVEWDGPNPADISIHATDVDHAVQPYLAISDHADRLEDLEAQAADRDHGDATESAPASDNLKADATQAAQTPLEQVVGLPEHVAEEQLSANQDRARFVASDVTDYAQRVPAGWSIPSADLRRVLQAHDGSGHTQTVQRVMEIACDLGGEDVWTVDRRGTRRLVFSAELVDRLDALDAPNHDVVMAAEG